jgi:hypothetical protein
MWKRLNKILHDKNDYHLDPSLKNEVAIADDLLQTTIKYQKMLIPRKFWYFIKFDKLFFLRLIAKYFLKFVIGLVIVGIVSIIILLVLGIDIDFKKTERKDFTNIPIYIPSSGDHQKDSLNILFYKRNVSKTANYILFYQRDPSKDYKKWKNALAGLESANERNPYQARREGSEYWGKYQMGNLARKAVKMERYTWEEWKINPDLQEAAINLWVTSNYDALEYEIKKFDGKFLNGWMITESGLIAMAHNVGPAAVKTFLSSGGKTIPKDGSGRDATRFLILGNFDLKNR